MGQNRRPIRCAHSVTWSATFRPAAKVQTRRESTDGVLWCAGWPVGAGWRTGQCWAEGHPKVTHTLEQATYPWPDLKLYNYHGLPVMSPTTLRWYCRRWWFAANLWPRRQGGCAIWASLPGREGSAAVGPSLCGGLDMGEWPGLTAPWPGVTQSPALDHSSPRVTDWPVGLTLHFLQTTPLCQHVKTDVPRAFSQAPLPLGQKKGERWNFIKMHNVCIGFYRRYPFILPYNAQAPPSLIGNLFREGWVCLLSCSPPL